MRWVTKKARRERCSSNPRSNWTERTGSVSFLIMGLSQFSWGLHGTAHMNSGCFKGLLYGRKPKSWWRFGGGERNCLQLGCFFFFFCSVALFFLIPSNWQIFLKWQKKQKKGNDLSQDGPGLSSHPAGNYCSEGEPHQGSAVSKQALISCLPSDFSRELQNIDLFIPMARPPSCFSWAPIITVHRSWDGGFQQGRISKLDARVGT